MRATVCQVQQDSRVHRHVGRTLLWYVSSSVVVHSCSALLHLVHVKVFPYWQVYRAPCKNAPISHTCSSKCVKLEHFYMVSHGSYCVTLLDCVFFLVGLLIRLRSNYVTCANLARCQGSGSRSTVRCSCARWLYIGGSGAMVSVY